MFLHEAETREPPHVSGNRQAETQEPSPCFHMFLARLITGELTGLGDQLGILRVIPVLEVAEGAM